jgi:hypothetical protein
MAPPRAPARGRTLKGMRKVTRSSYPDGTIVVEVQTTPETEMSTADLAVERALEPAVA